MDLPIAHLNLLIGTLESRYGKEDPDFQRLRDMLGALADTLSDNTTRKLTEIDLHIQQDRLTYAQELAQMGIFECDLVAGTAYCTPECEQLYGVPTGTIKFPGDWRRLVHPDDVDRVVAHFTEKVQQHLPFCVFQRSRTAIPF